VEGLHGSGEASEVGSGRLIERSEDDIEMWRRKTKMQVFIMDTPLLLRSELVRGYQSTSSPQEKNRDANV
jgi:hypothetical protein